MTHDFPTLQELIAIHGVLIEELGGAAGIRDEGALISALMRPQLGYYDTLIAEAAGLMESLANYHPFLDGNKRVAIFGTDTFLRINGHFINCDHEKAYAYFMELFDSNRFQFAELEEWLESHTQAL